MPIYKKIKTSRKYVEVISLKLLSKNFLLFKGSKGFIMCGYLNLGAAKKFKDVAVKIIGVSTIKEALETTVHSCTPEAKNIGIRRGQPIKEVLEIIA